MRISTRILLMAAITADPRAHASDADACMARSGAVLRPLVELYTSEGCSSCPPADRWLSRRMNADAANFLAFHVDYWDEIGWADRFATPEYSRHQRQRVAVAGERNVYTPQVMLGSQVQANWRNDAAWQRSLQSPGTARAALALRLVHGRDGWQAAVGATPVGVPAQGAQLWLARYVDAQVTQVRAGENRGAALRHDRVVRQLAGPWPLGQGALSRRIPLAGAGEDMWGVTAFVQDATGRVLQSLSLPVAACAPPAP